MSREDNLDKMARGREAGVVDALVRPIILEKVSQIVLQMCAYYRGGTLTNDYSRGKIAEISALQDLISQLDSEQRQGDAAAQKEMGNAPERPQNTRPRT